MRIVLHGYGRMGRETEQAARRKGHEISVILDSRRPLAGHPIEGDVVIDFSTAAAVAELLPQAARCGVPVVSGTTGWDFDRGRLERIQGLTLLFSPNFSTGVHVLNLLVAAAAEWLDRIGGYDGYLHEWHHNQKADSPSGTARMLAETILSKSNAKTHIMSETAHGKIDPKALHITSTRAGRRPGIHEVGFDSASDLIQLHHSAHNRSGFAAGAVLAAEWIQGRSGVFEMEDFMQGLLKKEEVKGGSG